MEELYKKNIIYYPNGIIKCKSYRINGECDNIHNSALIIFHNTGKIWGKTYYIHGIGYRKLEWMNKIKNL
jgi:antitoxin component YwqK of YwqJK toxin-antitoxin module